MSKKSERKHARRRLVLESKEIRVGSRVYIKNYPYKYEVSSIDERGRCDLLFEGTPSGRANIGQLELVS